MRLAVPRDARDPQDLARADVQADAFQPFDPVLVTDAQVLDLQDHGAGGGGLFLDLQQDLAAHHQFGQLFGAGLGGFHRGDHGPAPHDADVVGRFHDLAQLVGDQDDGLALVPEAAKDAEQMVRLGRGQDARGFVQDQDVGLAVQRLQDLYPLLVADRQVLDQGIGVHLQFVVAA